MKMIRLMQSYIDVEHEGERFRIGGEVQPRGFLAWLSWIDGLTPEGKKVPLSEQEQLRVMHLVKENWRNNANSVITFISDDYQLLCDTKDNPS